VKSTVCETIFDVVADMPNYGRWHRNSPLRFFGRTPLLSHGAFQETGEL
jgi:hypothetical protein